VPSSFGPRIMIRLAGPQIVVLSTARVTSSGHSVMHSRVALHRSGKLCTSALGRLDELVRQRISSSTSQCKRVADVRFHQHSHRFIVRRLNTIRLSAAM
jgi:hypothetical protein